MRIAYLIVPPRFVELAETIATAAGLGVSINVQLAMADFMADGGLRRHVHRMRAAYRARLTQLYQTLRESGGGRIRPVLPLGGLQLCAALPDGVSDTALVERLRASGLHALPLSALCHGPEWAGRSGLLLGVGLVGLDEVEPQARSLCAALATTG